MIQMPLFNSAARWLPPDRLPDLSDATEVAVDTETKDPKLTTKGPGYVRGDGYVVGIGISTNTGYTGYFPIRHEGGGNLDPAIVTRILKPVLAQTGRDYVFANAQYDLGWLRTLGLEIGGRVHDICIGDTLLDEERPDGYSLQALTKRWGLPPKNEDLLHESARINKLNTKGDLWRFPSELVGAYAETDPLRTLQVWQRIKPALRSQDLLAAYDLESQLIPVLFEMFWKGIRVDLDYAAELNTRWLHRERELLHGLHMSADDLWDTGCLARICDRHKISYPRTKKTGVPSITKEFMERSGHPVLTAIREARAIQRTRSIYLEQNLILHTINGRIHPQYIQMASDEGGTRTMRLACRNPNAQQFPKRSTLFDAKSLRKCLLPEEGKLWAKRDYWSQEPVIQCHYGLANNMAGAAEVAEQFKKGVKLYTFIEQATHGLCNYDQAKAIALGRSYGMGAAKMAATLGISLDESRTILDKFDAVVPYIARLADNMMGLAQMRGYIKTVAGHRRHFNLWQPLHRLEPRTEEEKADPTFDYTPRSEEAAKALWPGKTLERAWTYKAFNALIQGGAAGQTKTAMVHMAGSIGVPMMQMHDEISKSVTDEKEAAIMGEIMRDCIKLRAPVRSDLDLGTSWC